ncbi:MAG TPA: DUF4423 domain-containing protein [Bdellovibrio sp.]|nr:DUF4423 domain-containing protein [Bdellovibrio sp.]
MKSLFELQDYKVWINQHIRKLPHGGRGELSRIGNHLGIHVSLVSQILRGDKDFTIEQGHALTKYFGLNEIETEFFVLLIQINRAGTHALKSFFIKRRNQLIQLSQDLKNRLPIDRQLNHEEGAQFYSSWLYSAVRVYTSLDQGKTSDEIQKQFHLSSEVASAILTFLLQVGLCEKKMDRYTIGPQRTHLAFGSPFLKSHLSNWRIKSLESMTDLKAVEFPRFVPGDFLILCHS